MIKLIKLLSLSASLLSVGFQNEATNKINRAFDYEAIDAKDKKIIPRYDFERTLPDPGDIVNIPISQHDFATIEDFYINIDDYTGDTYKTSVNIVHFTYESLYIKFAMTTAEGETYVLGQKHIPKKTYHTRTPFDLIIDFTKMKSWATFTISCYEPLNPDVVNKVDFKLSKPKEIVLTSKELRVFWYAKFKNGLLSNEEIRVEIYNLPSLIYENYYLRVPIEKIYLRPFNRKYLTYDSSYVFIKDDYGYMKKAYDLIDPRFEGYVGNRFSKSHTNYNNLNYLSFNYNYYVDRRTHLMSKNSKEFEYPAPCTQFFMPKGKYEMYKKVECALYIKNIFSTGINVVYPFKVEFLNEHPDNRIIDSKSETISDDIYQKFMKEELV